MGAGGGADQCRLESFSGDCEFECGHCTVHVTAFLLSRLSVNRYIHKA